MNTRQMGQDKRFKVVNHIAKWQYTTQSLMCTLLDSKRTSQSRFFAKLLADNFIKEVPQTVTTEKVFMLTGHGKRLSLETSDLAFDYSTDVSRINPHMIRHNLQVQAVSLNLERGNTGVTTPERLLSYKSEAGRKIPDAIFDTGTGEVHAIEVELTYKKVDSIFRAFVNLWRFRKDEQYPVTKATYYFEKQAMLDHYKKLFEKSQWPLFSLENNKWVFQRNLDADGAREKLKAFFSFRRIDWL